MPDAAVIAHRAPNDAMNVNAPTTPMASALHAQLARVARIREAAAADPRVAAMDETAKGPVAGGPHTPATPWTATAPSGSLIRRRSTTSAFRQKACPA